MSKNGNCSNNIPGGKMKSAGVFLLFVTAILISCGDDSSSKSKENKASGGAYQFNTCPEVGDCQLACEDTVCLDECVQASDPVALALFDDYFDCAVENCSDGVEGCISARCPTEENACNGTAQSQTPQAPDLPTLRHYNCTELAQCLGDCPDAACTDACISFSTESAVQTFSAFLQCYTDCTDAGGIDCADTTCESEATACLNDVSG